MNVGEEQDEELTPRKRVQVPFSLTLLVLHVLEEGVVMMDGSLNETVL